MSRSFVKLQEEFLQVESAIISGLPIAVACKFYGTEEGGADVSDSLIAINDKSSTVNYHLLYIRHAGEDLKVRILSVDDSENEGEYASADYTIDTWHHACGIWVATDDRRVFLNGANKGVSTGSCNPTGLDRVSIGRNGDFTPAVYMGGMIAEVAIYDISAYPGATASDKADYFEVNILPDLAAGDPPDRHTTGLLAYWPLRTDSLEDEADDYDLTATGTSVSEDHPPMIRYLQGSVAGASGVSGSLDSQPELGSTIVEISGASATLGSVEVLTSLAGSIAGASGIKGILTGIWTYRGVLTETFGIDGSLNVDTELIGTLTSDSGIDGFLSIATELIGALTEGSDVDGSLSVATELGSSVTEISGASGSLGALEVVTELQGSISGSSNVSGIFEFLISFTGSIIFGSTFSGALNVDTGLGSTITEISGASGSLGALEVATELQGVLTGASGADGTLTGIWTCRGVLTETFGIDGSLSVDTELIGALTSDSDIDGSLSILRGLTSLYGDLVGSSSLFGYLTIIPDFEAATLFWRPQNNILETLEWNTSILKAHDGTEQRIKVRQSPRQYFKLQLILDLNSETDDINTWFDSVLHTWQKQAWLIPVWTEFVVHTSDISIKADFIDVDTTNADFRNTNKAIIWKSATEYEVIVIDTKTDSRLNLGYSVLNSYIGDKYIIPVRTAYLVSSSRKQKTNSPVSIIDLVFAVYDNINITDYLVEDNYDFLTLLSTPAFMDSIHSEDSDGDIIISDFETGIFKVESDSIFNFLSQNHVFFNDTKEECWKFRQFLYSLNGRQKTVLIPTFRNDVVQAAIIEDFETFVDIDNIKLADNMGFNVLRTYIGFCFPDGTFIIRKIIDISEIDSSIERINFNTVLDYGSSIDPGDCKICFVDKCRLASDRVEIFWPDAHKNECRTNFMRVR